MRKDRMRKDEKSNDETIHQLLEQYYRMIGPWHHKDSDCHWYIEINYCSYEDIVYRVYHGGYLYDSLDDGEEVDSFEKAQELLISHLRVAIAQESIRQVEIEEEDFEKVFGFPGRLVKCSQCDNKIAAHRDEPLEEGDVCCSYDCVLQARKRTVSRGTVTAGGMTSDNPPPKPKRAR